MTGGRLKRIKDYIGNETFMMTYGDGVSNVNIKELLEFHRSHGKYATLTAVYVGQRFGVLDIDRDNGETRHSVRRRLRTEAGLMPDIWYWSRRYLIISRAMRRYLSMNTLRGLAADNQLVAYKHDGDRAYRI